jgi:uncharacterized protein
MTTEDLVDAALRGLDMGERVTATSVHDETLLRNQEQSGVSDLRVPSPREWPIGTPASRS